MILTRLWAVILAVLGTACLAGMFMLSAGATGDFDDSDREALRAIAEAGVAALDAEIRISPVRLASTLRNDERLVEALARAEVEPDELEPGQYPMPQVLAEVTEEHRVEHQTNTTLAAIDQTGRLLAVNGIAEPSMSDLVSLDAYKEVAASESALFSVVVGGEVYAANVMPTDENGNRLVAVEPLNIGAGSVLRRVMGSTQPAALVRKDKIVGGIIGDQPLSEELKALAREHLADAPNKGASKVFSVGEGLDSRIGAIGRMPGPAGAGSSGVVLAIISRRTAAAGQQDLGDALRQAQAKGVRLNWALLGSLLLVSVGLALYLPSLEGSGPIRRLTAEFQAVATGTQHQIFHDRYGGPAGLLARTAAGTIEALRQAFLAELEIDEDDVGDVAAPPSRGGSKARTSRARRLTHAHELLKESGVPESQDSAVPAPMPRASSRPMEVPESDGAHTVPMTRRPAPVAPNSPLPPPPVPGPAPAAAPPLPPAAAPPSLPSPPVGPATAAPPPPPPAAPSASDKDAYYREIFDEFVQVKLDCGEPTQNLSFDRFAAKLRKNERDLKASRPEVLDVEFSVYIKDGRAALKAKIVR